MNDNAWDTQCEQVPGWDIYKCCPTCHDDAYEYGFEPCSVEIDGKTLYICCKCWDWWMGQR